MAVVSWIAIVVSVLSIAVSGGVAWVNQRDKARFEARMAYDLEARKRLLTAVGPLRFQLLVACRDVVGRVQKLGSGRWNTDVRSYFGRDTLYRVLRPVAIAELIERQVNYVDFSVDPAMPSLLRFQAAALDCFTDSSPVLDATGAELAGVNWSNESEHPFSGTVRAAAGALIVVEADSPERVARREEFQQILSDALKSRGDLARFAGFIDGLTPDARPLFWLRLIFYGYLCQRFVSDHGKPAGLSASARPWPEMLQNVGRDDIQDLAGVLEERMRRLTTDALAN
ncbi:hypothetical protein [Lentzea flava]|uniref:Uncharacterized protein n=1 Tax=Lentzea flava TaxID=103732 RepID=A0ABQ2UA94_9PSEU|nr:hypothetical protein [Lentzea flava]MCP2196703.1 hypothetical protein [Lentzea flava]GGU16102.1 hypothetical protein GCM10010178_04680 [Lentzea flava]